MPDPSSSHRPWGGDTEAVTDWVSITSLSQTGAVGRDRLFVQEPIASIRPRTKAIIN